MTEIKGWHVLTGFILAFGVIIAVNLTLAFNALRTFPGLEVQNSYVASQSFEKDRKAQLSLGWDVEAVVGRGRLELSVFENGRAIQPKIETAVFGRATNVSKDQNLDFVVDDGAFVAPVIVSSGNWNLRLRMRSSDGKLFSQRLQLKVEE